MDHPISAAGRTKMQLQSDPQAVRDGLCTLLAMVPFCNFSDDARGSVEIVLAEVLNNIVEHAYAECGGHIDLTLDFEHPTLSVEVVDTGLAMPAETLPAGALSPIDGNDDLPEGGFGWFLIRSLTRGLVYHRRSDRNMLAFWMEVA